MDARPLIPPHTAEVEKGFRKFYRLPALESFLVSDLEGARVLVTGAASGLGRCIALGSARRRSELVLWDVNREGLENVAGEVEAQGTRAHIDVVDVSKREDVYEAAGRVPGPLDVLINNAGVVSGKSLLEIPDEKIERTFAVNTLALFWTVKAFLPAMIERRRGHIVTIASAAGLIGVPKLTDYGASKWAAVGFDESLRMELRKLAPAIRTTVVCPYYLRTGLFEGAKSRFPALLPILGEETAAERILRAIERDKKTLVMPAMVHTIPWVRLLPVSWFDAVAEFMGINASMDDFTGRR
jgi:all-trans-retinol dehydrogenase (NAD+)